MKVLVCGATGMLGHKLCQRLSERFDVAGTTRERNPSVDLKKVMPNTGLIGGLDANDIGSFERTIELERPDVVVNAIGVIKQSSTSSDVVPTLEANSILPHELARICQAVGSRLITISTDCVFSGSKGNYAEHDVLDATDLYGISKRFGEPAGGSVLVLRTSIIGPEIQTRRGLLEWFLSNAGGSVKGFAQAIFSGFPTVVLADLIGDLIEHHASLSGTYHVSSDRISKFDLLQLIRDAYGLDIEISPSEELVIDRSLDSSALRRATHFTPQLWRAMIERMYDDHRG